MTISVLYIKGDSDNISKYRATSLLCNFTKVVEMDIKIQLIYLTENHKRLSNKQNGFREQRSIQTSFSQYRKETISRLDQGNYVIGLSIKFSRAFNMDAHSILIRTIWSKRFTTQSVSNLPTYKQKVVNSSQEISQCSVYLRILLWGRY